MIIGISGKMRTGKNVVASYLCDHYQFYQVAFANALKRLGIEFFGLTQEECFHQKTMKSRDVLQRIGVAWRDIDENVWCRYVLKNIPEGQSIVISDVRFLNEAKMIKDYGGKLVRLVRKTEEQYGQDHISETALDHYEQFDFFIDNNGSLQELCEKINDMILTLFGSIELKK